MFSENQKISPRQASALLLMAFLGTPLLFLPARLAQIGGRQCWQIMAVGALAALAVTPVLTCLWKREPGWTAVEWFRSVFGYGLGGLLSLGLGWKLLVDGAFELRIFAEVIRRAMLPYTPLPLLLGSLFLLSFLAARRGVECSGRAAEILLVLVWVPLLALLLAAAVSVDQPYFLPLALPSAKALWQGLAVTQPLYQPMSFLLFLGPFLAEPKKAGRSVWKTMVCAGALFTGITFLCLAVYGPLSLSQKAFASLQAMERVSMNGIFLTRQDLFLLWFWAAAVFLFLTGSLFFGGVFLQRLTGKGEKGRRIGFWAFGLALLALALLPPDLEWAYTFRNRVQPVFSGVYLALFPVIFLIKSWAAERGRRHG
ncbi:GerAB/ArcD/ProY family transporter [Anaerotignum lactatifermentans]|uniref:GerAB/ArcD/ProY family transporter n=1 Tax=Anaerotignum lactatifermentans TaxID=160404 RepID=A0ABS2G9T7_9FIRM|nr:GerAB/ArcD/ProY family transporter [Anaerotignum lactatifermentans]MBM6829065.1 GerAB/ArcD/ProY family transporter [Anaerotignum lactatifermentans]MBM6877328.1 GerAB/ArcD/ProY family transporter [Anaerotignum lactatifermentans]MBM6950699.1 GerAB/ArcD/ProY family transporter [Anaerotignum lactatifermentans]